MEQGGLLKGSGSAGGKNEIEEKEEGIVSSSENLPLSLWLRGDHTQGA